MTDYNSAFELKPECNTPYEAARSLAEDLQGNWEVIEVKGSEKFKLVTEEE